MKKNIFFVLCTMLFFSCHQKTIDKFDLNQFNELFTDVSPSDTSEYFTSISGEGNDVFVGDNLGNIYYLNDSTNIDLLLFNASKNGNAIYKTSKKTNGDYIVGTKNEGLKIYDSNKRRIKQYKIGIKKVFPFDGTQYSVYDFMFCDETNNWLVCTSNGFYESKIGNDTLKLIYPDEKTLKKQPLSDFAVRNIIYNPTTKSYYASTLRGIYVYSPASLSKHHLLLSGVNIQYIFYKKDSLFALSNDSVFVMNTDERITRQFSENKKRLRLEDDRNNTWTCSDRDITIKNGNDSIIITPSVDERLSENPRGLVFFNPNSGKIFFISKDKIYRTYSYSNFYSSHEQNIVAATARENVIYFANNRDEIFCLNAHKKNNNPVFVGNLNIKSKQKIRNLFVFEHILYAVTEQEVYSQPIPSRWNFFNKKATLIYKEEDGMKIKSAFLYGHRMLIGGKFGLKIIELRKDSKHASIGNVSKQFSVGNAETIFGSDKANIAIIKTLEGKTFYINNKEIPIPIECAKGQLISNNFTLKNISMDNLHRNIIYVNDLLYYNLRNKKIIQKSFYKGILHDNELLQNTPYNLSGCIALGDSLLFVGSENGCLKINTQKPDSKQWLEFQYLQGIKIICFYLLLLVILPAILIFLLQRVFHFTILQKKSVSISIENIDKRIQNLQTLLEKFNRESEEYHRTFELNNKVISIQQEIKNNPERIWEFQKSWDEVSLEVSKLNGLYNELCIIELKEILIEKTRKIRDIELEEASTLAEKNVLLIKKKNPSIPEFEEMKSDDEVFLNSFNKYLSMYEIYRRKMNEIAVERLLELYIPIEKIENYGNLIQRLDAINRNESLMEKIKNQPIDDIIKKHVEDKIAEVKKMEIDANDADLILQQLNDIEKKTVFGYLFTLRNVNQQIEQSKILTEIAQAAKRVDVKFKINDIDKYNIPKKIDKFFMNVSDNDKQIILKINSSNDLDGQVCRIIPVVLAVPKLNEDFLDRSINGRGAANRKTDLKKNIQRYKEKGIAEFESAILWSRIKNLYFSTPAKKEEDKST